MHRTKIAAAIVVLVSAIIAPSEGRSQTNAAAASPDTLTSNWSARMQLEEQGIEPFATLTSEVWGNAAGGLKSGGWYNQLLDFGFQLDTAKLGWWEGGSFFVQAHWVEHSGNASCFEEYTGAFNPVSSIMAGDQLRIFNLYYQQVWNNDNVLLKFGQIAADDDFMWSDYSGLFLNSAFGAMPSQVGTPLATSCGNSPAFPIYSVAAPGIFVRVRPSESIYTQLGLYYGRPGLDQPSNHGFDWVNQTPPELGLFWESGYSYKLAQHPATIRFGLTYHTGPLDDFSGMATGNPPATRQAVPNYYAIHDLQLLADHEGNPKLGLFCRGGITPEMDKSMVSHLHLGHAVGQHNVIARGVSSSTLQKLSQPGPASWSAAWNRQISGIMRTCRGSLFQHATQNTEGLIMAPTRIRHGIRTTQTIAIPLRHDHEQCFASGERHAKLAEKQQKLAGRSKPCSV